MLQILAKLFGRDPRAKAVPGELALPYPQPTARCTRRYVGTVWEMVDVEVCGTRDALVAESVAAKHVDANTDECFLPWTTTPVVDTDRFTVTLRKR